MCNNNVIISNIQSKDLITVKCLHDMSKTHSHSHEVFIFVIIL